MLGVESGSAACKANVLLTAIALAQYTLFLINLFTICLFRKTIKGSKQGCSNHVYLDHSWVIQAVACIQNLLNNE